MKITDSFSITKRAKDGAFYGTRNGVDYVIRKEDDEAVYKEYETFYSTIRAVSFGDRPSYIKNLEDRGAYPDILGIKESYSEPVTPKKEKPIEILTRAMKGLIDFFSEFGFTPSFRFTNTLAFLACKDKDGARTYVGNYFALMDSSYTKEVRAPNLIRFSMILSLMENPKNVSIID